MTVTQQELDKETLLRIFISKDKLKKLIEINNSSVNDAIKRRMIKELYNKS